MGSGGSAQAAGVQQRLDDLGIKDSMVDAASKGDQEAQDLFFQRLDSFAACGDPDSIHLLLSKWKKAVQTFGAREATCVAVKNGQPVALKALLDAGVRPYIGRNDPLVNPLIHAMELQEWPCAELLVPRALKYNFSTELLQNGMVDFVKKGDLEMVQRLLKEYKIPGAGRCVCTCFHDENESMLISCYLYKTKDYIYVCICLFVYL